MGFIRKWKQHGHKVGKFDHSGNKIDTLAKAEAYSGQLYGSREEAVDLRTSEGVETKKDNKSVFGGKRANLFGN
jgi:hypothetical protein